MGKYIGIIDLGSNTARLVVYFVNGHGIFQEYDNVKRVLRLSNHLGADGRIDAAGIQITLECLRQFKELCDAREVTEIIGIATAAVREARNGPELLAAIEQETGIRMRLLSGSEEARYGYLAVINSMEIETAITIDIGGGSTEVTYFHDRKLRESFSFPFGIVTLTKQFLHEEIPSPQDLNKLTQFLEQQFATQPWLAKRQVPLIAMGGTARNLAKIHQYQVQYSMASLHHYSMNLLEVDGILKLVSDMPLAERKNLNGLSKDRADVIIAGIAVLYALLKRIAGDQLIISQKGLRDGVLYEMTLRDREIANVDDIVMLSSEQFMHRYQVHQIHARHVRDLALTLFDELRTFGLLDMGPAERKLLEVAALLHDIGRSINVYETSQHTFYLLSNVLLLGLTHKERLLIAMISSYKNNKQVQQQISLHSDLVFKTDKPMIEKLGYLVLLARALDRSMTQQIQHVQLKEKKNQIVLECYGTKRDLVEYTMLEEILDKVSKVFKHPFAYTVKQSI